MAIFRDGEFTKNWGEIRQKSLLIAIDFPNIGYQWQIMTLLAKNGDGKFAKTEVKFAKIRHTLK